MQTSTLVKKLTLAFSLVIVLVIGTLFSPPITQAVGETCGTPPDDGICRTACSPVEMDLPAKCPTATDLCCFPRAAITSCSDVCSSAFGCTCPANCVKATVDSGDTCGGPAAASNVLFGTIAKPPGVEKFDAGSQIGILNFISALIKLFTVVSGLIVLFNFFIAGYSYITSDGNSKAHEEVRNRITYSVLGLIIIVCAYTLIGIISLIFFGDAGFILNPKIT